MKHKSLTPWLVAAVCFGPFAAALFLYYGRFGQTWLPQLPGSRELLAQPVAVPPEWQGGGAGEWQLIYARMASCEQQCAQHLARLQQVQVALGRDQDRVQRALWHVGELPDLDPKLVTHALDDDVGRGVAKALNVERLNDGRVFVANPRGLVIVSYPPDVEQKELLRDLKRLLTGAD
jgi:cytochrome oxidase Cu insertion factor (SCO1/SenC/PrrC family)